MIGFLGHLVRARIQAYSKMATSMKARHATIHLTRAVAVPLALGVSLETEFRVLTMQRKRVSSIAILPGMTCGGIRKLT